MQPRDILMFRDERFGHHRFWEIQSICLGALGQESLIELKPLSQTPGRDTEGSYLKTTWVPELLIRGHEIFTPSPVKQ